MPEKTVKFRRLDLQDRLTLQKGITDDRPFAAIAAEIGCVPSTLRREVRRNRVRDRSSRYGYGIHRFCANEKGCSIHGLCAGCSTKLCRVCRSVMCTRLCSYYEQSHCRSLQAAPYCCNGCTKKRTCDTERFIYDAAVADEQAHQRRVSARAGIDLDLESAREIERWIVPLLKDGHSPEQIYLNHAAELPFCQRTLYSYIAAGVFAGTSNFDLHRKVRYKLRQRKPSSRPKDLSGHTYADFLALDVELQTSAVEGDTVIGRPGGKCLQTLLFRNCSLMLIFLLDECNQDCIYETFANLSFACVDYLDGFASVFKTLLFDRGSEFLDYKSIELLGYSDTGNPVTRIYYCNPRHPEQKGALEKNHEYIREVLPKGTSFDDLTGADIDLLTSHINSIPRASLGGKTPYETACFIYGQELIDAFGVSFIEPDKVIRRPKLLEK